MANFFHVTFVFVDGHKEEYEGQLYYIGGEEHPDMELYKELRRKYHIWKMDGTIKDAYWSYES